MGVIGQRMAHTIPSPPHVRPPRASLCSAAIYSFLIQRHYFHLFTHLFCLFPTFLYCQPLYLSSHTSLSCMCVEPSVRMSVCCGRKMLLLREDWERVEEEWEALKSEKPVQEVTMLNKWQSKLGVNGFFLSQNGKNNKITQE